MALWARAADPALPIRRDKFVPPVRGKPPLSLSTLVTLFMDGTFHLRGGLGFEPVPQPWHRLVSVWSAFFRESRFLTQ